MNLEKLAWISLNELLSWAKHGTVGNAGGCHEAIGPPSAAPLLAPGGPVTAALSAVSSSVVSMGTEPCCSQLSSLSITSRSGRSSGHPFSSSGMTMCERNVPDDEPALGEAATAAAVSDHRMPAIGPGWYTGPAEAARAPAPQRLHTLFMTTFSVIRRCLGSEPSTLAGRSRC